MYSSIITFYILFIASPKVCEREREREKQREKERERERETHRERERERKIEKLQTNCRETETIKSEALYKHEETACE